MKTTNPSDFKELFQVFYLALSNGLISKKEAIDWADNIIKNDDEPEYFIIELSLSGHKSINEVLSLISDYCGPEKSNIAGRVILGILYAQYITEQISLKKLAIQISRQVWKPMFTDIEKSFMYGLDDCYDLAINGTYGTIEDFRKNTVRFIEIFKDLNINNFSEWEKISEQIDQKIDALVLAIKKEEKHSAQLYEIYKNKKWWKLW